MSDVFKAISANSRDGRQSVEDAQVDLGMESLGQTPIRFHVETLILTQGSRKSSEWAIVLQENLFRPEGSTGNGEIRSTIRVFIYQDIPIGEQQIPSSESSETSDEMKANIIFEPSLHHCSWLSTF